MKLLFKYWYKKIVSVNTARIEIERDDNPSGVVIYSTNDVEYYIDINEDENTVYVIEVVNGNENILGTCSLTITFENEMIEYTNDSCNSCGCITIFITDCETNEGYIQEVSGDLSNIFRFYDNVKIVN